MECAANQKTQGFGVEGDEVAMKSPDIFLERASLEDHTRRDFAPLESRVRVVRPKPVPVLGARVIKKALERVAHPLEGECTTTEGEFQSLTAKEREVVQLLAEGKSSKESADVLKVSTKTLETHRSNIMRKLGCHSVTEVVRYAIRNHLAQA